MKNHLCIFTITLFSMAVSTGCSKENERRADSPGVQTREERASSETRSAAASLTQARCSREQRCQNIGADKKYSSFADCEAEVGNDWRDDLNARECSSGINQAQLDECLTEVRNEDCGNPFDSLERVAACTQGQICEG